MFDCSTYKQADIYVTTLKGISEHIVAIYKQSGDVRSSMINKTKVNLAIPTAPVIVDPNALMQQEVVHNMIFKSKIDAFIKRKGILNDNIQKAYSLVLRQCTDLLQS